MSAVPKQVQQQLDEIEAAIATPAQTEDTAPPPSQQDSAPQEAAQTPTNVVDLRPETPPQEDWKARYDTLRGKFDAEVPRLHAQNKELVQQLQALHSKMEELSKPKPVEQQPERLVTDKDEAEFGAELIDVQRRVAKDVFREFVTPLQSELKQRDARIAQLEQALNQTSGDVSTMSFEQRLNQAVPNFQVINNDPKWIAWLDEVDPFTGEPRRAYAEYVYNQGNVAKVKAIVDLFTGQQPTAPSQRNEQRKAEFERQVQPPRSAASSSAPSQGERTYTEVELNRLWDKVQKLNMNGRYDDAASLEAELTQAMTQGRVRG